MARGRPRGFDRDEALRSAMELFWRWGYEGVSISMLTAALGITPTSLYAAFGSKDELFEAAVEMYDAPGRRPTDRALLHGNVHVAIEAVLRDNADAYTDPETPAGCMVVLSAVNLGPAHEDISRKVADRRRDDAQRIEERIRDAITAGELPEALDARAAAGFVQTVLHGLSMQARDGCTRAFAHKIVDAAMCGWHGMVAQAAGR